MQRCPVRLSGERFCASEYRFSRVSATAVRSGVLFACPGSEFEARVAGIDRIRFQHLLASRSIPVNYDAREFESDRKTIDSMP
jgi:hypothetical protein